jgi:hypothetical protein
MHNFIILAIPDFIAIFWNQLHTLIHTGRPLSWRRADVIFYDSKP